MPTGLSDGRDSPWRDKDLLEHKYWSEHKSIREISEDFDCNHKTVARWLDKFDIDRRSPGHPAADPELRNADKLHELYWEKQLSTQEISEIYECSRRQISYWLNKHDIDIRPAHGGHATHPDTWDELSETELREEYVTRGKSLAQIAEEYGTTPHPVKNALERNGIETREQYPSGKDNPAWNGGGGTYHHIRRGLSDKSWPTLRKRLIEKYGTECHWCGRDVGASIQMHHIIPVLCGGSNHPDMFLPLCRSCHNSVESYTTNLPEVKSLEEYANEADNQQCLTDGGGD